MSERVNQAEYAEFVKNLKGQLGVVLSGHRNEKGLTVDSVASSLDLTTDDVIRMEHGLYSDLPVALLDKYCSLYGVERNDVCADAYVMRMTAGLVHDMESLVYNIRKSSSKDDEVGYSLFSLCEAVGKMCYKAGYETCASRVMRTALAPVYGPVAPKTDDVVISKPSYATLMEAFVRGFMEYLESDVYS